MVDYTQTGEFGGRVKTREADGARLHYDRYLPLEGCATVPVGKKCFEFDSRRGADREAINNKVKEVVAEHGWPRRNDEYFLVDTSYGASGWDFLWRWKEIPVPYLDQTGYHGTFVASVAAGKTLGVAPGATVIPLAKNFESGPGSNDQQQAAVAEELFKRLIEDMSVTERVCLMLR